ncbi:hypothetical protein GP486_004430 [Trichoglossum hirsutum]|uniref:DUF6589 domain-containing protein n=1 Tax=Trichoglossum hirsutum TaxID=265104 RepID=A0A9P8LB34_9PEZI|nr:hypothetical protein GP486_004430 [Trichoglossum hirsutum]
MFGEFCVGQILHRDEVIISWDNFDYNQNVRHQTLREPAKHLLATTGKFCISQLLLDCRSHPPRSSRGTVTDHNPTTRGQMRKRAVLTNWPELPSIEFLSPRKTPHYDLGPILENENTISSTYGVIDKVFTEQLGYNPAEDFGERLHPVYDDQKMVSLIHTVQKVDRRQRFCMINTTGSWLSGLSHWRTNYMDMTYDTYTGSEHTAM